MSRRDEPHQVGTYHGFMPELDKITWFGRHPQQQRLWIGTAMLIKRSCRHGRINHRELLTYESHLKPQNAHAMVLYTVLVAGGKYIASETPGPYRVGFAQQAILAEFHDVDRHRD